jgi:hypothetical protein
MLASCAFLTKTSVGLRIGDAMKHDRGAWPSRLLKTPE